jgi:SAM-dependent methyltransferase
MNLSHYVHDSYVHHRRIRVLCSHLVQLLPARVSVLDVGCGDGLLAWSLQQRRSDVTIQGIDVLVRARTYISVEKFDGHHIPYADKSFDVIMFVDVLHHTIEPLHLLREAVRVASIAVIIKDHLLQGWCAGPTLRAMDDIGNAHHGVALPHNYWSKKSWMAAFELLGLKITEWKPKLGLYPWPASWIFDRSLHFVARLELA